MDCQELVELVTDYLEGALAEARALEVVGDELDHLLAGDGHARHRVASVLRNDATPVPL